MHCHRNATGLVGTNALGPLQISSVNNNDGSIHANMSTFDLASLPSHGVIEAKNKKVPRTCIEDGDREICTIPGDPDHFELREKPPETPDIPYEDLPCEITLTCHPTICQDNPVGPEEDRAQCYVVSY